MRLTWKREERERGLAGIAQGERGYDLRMGGKVVGYVRPFYESFSRVRKGYYWAARDDILGVRFRSEQSYTAVEEAKAACLAYVKAELERAKA